MVLFYHLDTDYKVLWTRWLKTDHLAVQTDPTPKHLT